MTPHQKELIRTSWQEIEKMDLFIVGDAFYSKLFLDAPHVRPLFKSSRIDQAKKLVDTLQAIVYHLDKLDTLTASLKQLALRHQGYGIRPEYYPLLGKALVWSLERLLADHWSEELKQAWTECYDMIAGDMIAAYEPAHAPE